MGLLRTRAAALFIATAVVGLLFSSVSEGKVKEFSADQVRIDASGNAENNGKIYYAHEKMRMEGMGMRKGRATQQEEMIIIVRGDKKLHWMINPKKKAYFERAVDEKEIEQLSGLVGKGVEKDLGTETVQGYKCRKKQITNTVDIMGFKKTVQSIIWMSDDFPMPLRSQTSEGGMTELRNIKEGRQPSDLFELPSDYVKVESILELMDESPHRGSKKRPKEGGEGEKGGSSVTDAIKKAFPKGFKMPGSGE
jgi:hypothetical protein